MPPTRRHRRPTRIRRAERELFFWTARETLKLILRAALTVYFVTLLVQGRITATVLLEVAARLISLLR